MSKQNSTGLPVAGKAIQGAWRHRQVRERLFCIMAVVGCSFGVRHGYWHEQPLILFGSLAAAIGAVAVWLTREEREFARIGWLVWQRCAAASLMFVVVEGGYKLHGLWLTLQKSHEVQHAGSIKAVTFEEAQGDSHAFAAWWKIYNAEWHRDSSLIQESIRQGPVPYVFKPNTSRPFFDGRIEINSLGLSDREVALDKGDKFRIVVMGSSHVLCPPLTATDTPWPAKLERLIREQLPAGREVEVLNAGATGYTMMNNLHRLQKVVLPLKPDLIITYFGYNEFGCFQADFNLPRIPPTPKMGGSVLLGKLDSRFQKWMTTILPIPAPLDVSMLESKLVNCRLAREYRDYLRIARERGVPLVVCNFNLAVDERSPDKVIRFYEQGFPDVRYMTEANRINTAMLPLVIRPEAGARLLHVQDGLDGEWQDNYVDLVHLSESGKQRLAENVLREIRDLLPQASKPDLYKSPSRMADRSEAARPGY